MASARVATRISSNSLAQDHQDQMAVQAGIEIFQLGSQLFGKAQFARAFCVWEGLCLLLSTTLSSSSSDSTDETYWVAALQEARQSAHQVQDLADATFSSPVDTYLEDECDVGPRPFCRPLPITTTTTSLESLYLLGVYHCGLAQHAQGHSSVAARFYTQVLAESLEDSFQLEQQHSSSLLHVMVHNNLAQLRYAEHAEEVASRHMEAALVLAKQALSSSSSSFPLTIPQLATLLSNWCRIRWMLGDLSDAIHAAMEEILHMRSQHLPCDHVDVAASHFNLGVSFYSNRHFDAALKHLTKYLEIASACNNKTKKQTKGDAASRLDPIPALCYVLLTKVMTSWKSRSTARDIEEGVQSLLEKRSELGCHNPEVASILNYVGTLLFHQNDLEYALLFFQEELRVEEELHQASLCSSEEVSVSVTCNNIGRILQELGRFPEAIYYYERSLESEFGSAAVTTSSRSTKAVPSSQATKTLSSTKKNSPVNTTSTQTASSSSRSNNNTKKATYILSNLHNMPSATMNLYSTVWYNLGLIHDKMGAFADAIHAFVMSLHLRTAMLGPDHSDVACLLYNIGVLQMEQGRLDDATSSFREALRIRRICLSGGQLNDKHIVRTLQKLAALHKAKGHIAGALLIGQEVICLLQSIYFQQQESSTAWRLEWAAAWREVAELHHATSQLTAALHAATESLSVLRRQTSKKSPPRTAVWMEHECATLLLMGSLQHELCQPLQAQATFGLVEQILSQQQQHMALSPSLLPMREVSHLLASSAGAPQA